jgi:hypothetical protein
MIIAAQIISRIGTFWSVQPCIKILSVLGNNTTRLVQDFPLCQAFLNGNHIAQTIVHAEFHTAPGIIASTNEAFGAAGWLALLLHAVGVEIYVSDRLLSCPSRR